MRSLKAVFGMVLILTVVFVSASGVRAQQHSSTLTFGSRSAELALVKLIRHALPSSFALIHVASMDPFTLGQNSDPSKAQRKTKPAIRITRIPPAGAGEQTWGTVAGQVSGVDVAKCKVVVYAYGNTWYVQPWRDSPYTTISKDGRWETGTHLGYSYAALLVKSSFIPPAIIGTLPRVGGDVLAIVQVSAKR